jgi:hypothetical protein
MCVFNYKYKANKMKATTLNRLTQKQVWEISKNIEADIELYTNTEYSFIAEEMNKIFDYEITIHNIKHIKEVTGLKIGRPRNIPASTAQEDIKYIANLLLNTQKWIGDEVLLSIINKK